MAIPLPLPGWFDRLRSTYWFVPTLVTLTCFALAFVALTVDRVNPDSTDWMGWAYGGGAAGARELLSAVAGSMITVVSVTFSVMVVALTVSSQHFGPRLLNSFMRDNAAQLVLGTFTGTFGYCLIVLRTVQGGNGDGPSAFVPHLAVTGSVVLSLLSVGMLIYYVHHIAVSMQLSEITASVTADMERAIDRLYPERMGDERSSADVIAPAPPDGTAVVTSESSGYIQELDSDAVLGLAKRCDTVIWLTTRPGDFVVEGAPLAAARRPVDEKALSSGLRAAMIIGADRTPYQDVAFTAQQLVEVALRALSPGVNEPFTAITSIDRLSQGLARLASRRIPSPSRLGDDGQVRVVALPQTFGHVLQAAFEPIALYTERSHDVSRRLLERLRGLAFIVRRDDDRRAVMRVADFVLAEAKKHIDHEHHRSELLRLHGEVHRTIGETHGGSSTSGA